MMRLDPIGNYLYLCLVLRKFPSCRGNRAALRIVVGKGESRRACCGEGTVCREGDSPQVDGHRQEMIDGLAGWIRAHRLVEPAVLLLETTKPLLPIASQVLLFAQPLLGAIGPSLGWFDDQRVVADYAMLIDEPDAIERVLAILERRSGE